ncbi:hypothetical protein H8E50_13955 [bacterium]|nr:hypothetical protein [bacterium]
MISLDDKERSFMERIVRQQKIFKAVSIINVIVAATMTIFYTYEGGGINSSRFVIILLLLLSGKSSLRQYKSALLITKMRICIDTDKNGKPTDIK